MALPPAAGFETADSSTIASATGAGSAAFAAGAAVFFFAALDRELVNLAGQSRYKQAYILLFPLLLTLLF